MENSVETKSEGASIFGSNQKLMQFFLISLLVVIIILALPPGRITDPVARLLTGLAWPFVACIAFVLFRAQFVAWADVVRERVGEGADFKLWNILNLAGGSIAQKAKKIPAPTGGAPVTLENVALLHTSFIPKEKPKFKDSLLYLRIDIIVIAPDSVLDRIEMVTYRFDDAYPESNRLQISRNRTDRFKAKEYANGTSIVQAEIKFKAQDEPLFLNRFIDLRPDGPRI